MHSVKVPKGDKGLETALKRLKAKMDADSVLENVRNKRYFEDTQAKRKRKEKNLSRKIKLGR